LKDVNQDHAQQQTHQRCPNKPKQRFAPNTTHRTDVTQFGNAYNEGGEHERGHNHFDQAKENVSQDGKGFYLFVACREHFALLPGEVFLLGEQIDPCGAVGLGCQRLIDLDERSLKGGQRGIMLLNIGFVEHEPRTNPHEQGNDDI